MLACMASFGLLSGSRVRLVDSAAGLVVQIDTDGNAGPAVSRPLLTLSNVSAAQIVPTRDLGL